MNGYGLVLVLAPVIAIPAMCFALLLALARLIRWRTVFGAWAVFLSYLVWAEWTLPQLPSWAT
jgi:hypothetical protein